MIRFNMCPQLALWSFAVLFAIGLVVVFGVQLGVDGIARDKGTFARAKEEFLPIELKGTFTGALSNDNTKIKQSHQLYRPLTALIVHQSFFHILSTIFMLVIWTSYFEIYMGSYRTPIVFVLSGMIGHLASFAFDGPAATAMGAAAGLFGIIGAMIGYIILNWNNMNYAASPRLILVLYVVLILLITALLTSRFSQNSASLFGVIAGVFIGCFLSTRHVSPEGMPPDITTHEKTTQAIGISATVVLGGTFLIIALTR